MSSNLKRATATAVALTLLVPAAAQAQSSTSKANEKDYRSLQYGNGRITPRQNEGVKRRADALNQAMSDDGAVRPSPTPAPTRRRGSGTATPQ